MKKFVSLLLVLLFAVSLFACGEVAETPVTKLASLIDASKPTRVTTIVTYIVDPEAKTPTIYSGMYTTDVDGEDFILTYSYERMALIEEMADSEVITEEGVVYYKNGRYSEDGKTWTVDAPAAVNYYFRLDESLFTTCNIVEEGNTMIATVSGENAKEVFGTEVNAEGAVTLRLDSNGKSITGININYDTAQGAFVEIRTSYTYGPVTLNFPTAD